jgi:hypothetical protein
MPTGALVYFVSVVSPVSGLVERLFETSDHLLVSIYIRGPFDKKQDDHRILSPMTGAIIEIGTEHGTFSLDDQHFISDPGKKGHLTFKFANEVLVAVEVGSGYVTNEIEWFVSPTRLPFGVRKGQVLGEILLRPDNSRAYVAVPKSANTKIHENVHVGQELRGGTTVLFELLK